MDNHGSDNQCWTIQRLLATPTKTKKYEIQILATLINTLDWRLLVMYVYVGGIAGIKLSQDFFFAKELGDCTIACM